MFRNQRKYDSRYAMLHRYDAQRLEYESRPPVAWKHRQLAGWIAGTRASIDRMEAENDAHRARLADLRRQLARADARHRGDIEDALAMTGGAILANEMTMHRYAALAEAYAERYREGVEHGLTDYIGSMGTERAA